MAGGGFSGDASPATNEYNGRLTASVIITCFMAASGGLIFGYDVGISGGVSTMIPFLKQFFPEILQKMAASKQDQYCIYDSQVLATFTSSLYMAGLVSSLLAGRVTNAVGRRGGMILGSVLFLAGSAMNGAAVNVAMLISGRILLGFGVGFTNQATPVYLTEVAPAKWRGAFNTAFQFFIGVGVLAANITNIYSARLPWGWRISLGLAGAPAIIILLGAFFISDSPSSLVQRGKIEQARAALRSIRGFSDVDAELKGIEYSVEAAKENSKGAYREILRRKYRPQLTVVIAMAVFHQLTGVVVVAFFSPVLFGAIGFGSNGALLGAALLGAVNLASILLSSLIIDRFGRRVLFLQGGIQMFLCLVAVAAIMGVKIGTDGTAALPRSDSVLVLVLMCIFAAGFGWSWGPLSWVVPSEIFPVEVRSAGQSIWVAVNFTATIIQTQSLLAMLCGLKFGMFLFYASCLVAMTVFAALFIPETRGVPLPEMAVVWEKHWYWKRFVKEDKLTLEHA